MIPALRGPLTGLLVLLLPLALCALWSVRAANRLVRLRNRVSELDADVEAALARRFDQLTKEYQLLQQYCAHESRTLYETIRLRRGMTPDERADAAGRMDALSAQLQVTLEAYPQLRAHGLVMALQHSVADAEAHLQAARRLYNGAVSAYNSACQELPTALVARLTGHRPLPFFSAEPPQRQDVRFLP